MGHIQYTLPHCGKLALGDEALEFPAINQLAAHAQHASDVAKMTVRPALLRVSERRDPRDHRFRDFLEK